MITRLKVNNFQSHADTLFEFSPGINVITGESDVGKSGALRAFEWVARSRPSGDSFRRHDTKKTSVELDDVKKVRTASKHYYDVDGEKYKSLRTNVPEQVTEKLNLTDVNFQGQHDAYFLIGDSPGQVAKALNKVADLSLIDVSLKEGKRRLKEAKTNLVNLTEVETSFRERAKDTEWALSAQKDLKAIDEATLTVETISKAIDNLNSKIQAFKALEEAANNIPPVKGPLKAIEQAIRGLDKKPITVLQGKITRVEELQSENLPDVSKDLGLVVDQIADIETAEEKIRGLKSKLDLCVSLQEEETFDPGPAFKEIDKMIDLENALLKQTVANTKLNLQVSKYLAEEVIFNEASRRYDELHEKFNTALIEAGTCPLCGEITA